MYIYWKKNYRILTDTYLKGEKNASWICWMMKHCVGRQVHNLFFVYPGPIIILAQ